MTAGANPGFEVGSKQPRLDAEGAMQSGGVVGITCYSILTPRLFKTFRPLSFCGFNSTDLR